MTTHETAFSSDTPQFSVICDVLGVPSVAKGAFIRKQLMTSGSPLYTKLDRSLQKTLMDVPGESAVSVIGQSDSRVKKNRRVVPYALEPSDIVALEAMFDEFTCDFKSYKTCVNSLIRSVGLLAREALYNLLRGRPFRVVEFTGAFHEAVKAGRPHTHVCTVCESTYHYADARTEIAELHSLMKSMHMQAHGDNTMLSNLNRFFENPGEYMCMSPKNCRADADVLMFDMTHSFVPLLQVVSVAVARNAPRILGFFLYSQKMEEETDFYLDGLKIRVHIDRFGDLMHFYSEDGLMMAPVPYKEYLNLAKANSVRVGAHSFTYELFDKRGSLYFFRMQAIGDCKIDGLEHAIWRSDLKDTLYRVTSFRLKQRNDGIAMSAAFIDRNDARNYEPFIFYAPVAVVYNALLFSLGLPKGKLNRSAVLKRLEALSSRVVVDAVRVETVSKLTADQLNHLSYVIFVMAYQMRFDDAKVHNFLNKTNQLFDAMASGSFWKVAGTVAYQMCLIGQRDIDESLGSSLREYVLKNTERYPLQPSLEKVKAYDVSDLVLIYTSVQDYAGVSFNLAFGDKTLVELLVRGKTFVQKMIDGMNWKFMQLGVTKEKLVNYFQNLREYDLHDVDDRPDVPEVYGHQEIEEVVETYIDSGRMELAHKVLGDNELDEETPLLTLTVTHAPTPLTEEVKMPVGRSPYPLADLQEGYELVLPGNDIRSGSYDAFDIGYNDLNLRLDTAYTRITMSNKLPGSNPDVFEPYLETRITPDRPASLLDSLLGLQKRNFNVGMVEEPSHMLNMMDRVVKNFIHCFCVPDALDLLEFYRENPVGLTKTSLESWVATLPLEKIQKLKTCEFVVEKMDLACYNLMNRRKMKARTEATAEYQAPQTVVYHDAPINAYYSPIAREIMARLCAMLRPNIMIYNRKSVQDLNDFVQVYDSPHERTYYLENDFSKFDKSQQERCLMLEWFLMSLLGIKDQDLIRWINGHIHCVILDYKHGLKVHSVNQRKSGDATTTLGNTIVNLLTVADIFGTSLNHEKIKYGIFQGDDSLVALTESVDTAHVTHEMAFRFNLVSKSFVTEYGLICSMMIVKTAHRVLLMRDPIKIVEGLGRCRTDSEEVMRENHQSLVDVMVGYDDEINLRALEVAVQNRRGVLEPLLPMLRALFTIMDDYDEYRKLFSKSSKRILG